jgi:hypothetical protein
VPFENEVEEFVDEGLFDFDIVPDIRSDLNDDGKVFGLPVGGAHDAFGLELGGGFEG